MTEATRVMIPFENMSVEEAKKEFGMLMFTFQQQLCCDEERAAKMVSIATGVCHSCWEAGSDCQCWNDE